MQQRQIDVRLDRGFDLFVSHVRDHTDHLGAITKAPLTDADALADRVLGAPEFARRRFVDDHDLRLSGAVALVEYPSSQHANAEDVEVGRRGPEHADRRLGASRHRWTAGERCHRSVAPA